jgi:hypothetical protein
MPKTWEMLKAIHNALLAHDLTTTAAFFRRLEN